VHVKSTNPPIEGGSKKFVPKAKPRRRPAAGAAAAAKTSALSTASQTPAPTAPPPTTQTEAQPQPEKTPVPEPPVAVHLPTPAATQDVASPAVQDIPSTTDVQKEGTGAVERQEPTPKAVTPRATEAELDSGRSNSRPAGEPVEEAGPPAVQSQTTEPESTIAGAEQIVPSPVELPQPTLDPKPAPIIDTVIENASQPTAEETNSGPAPTATTVELTEEIVPQPSEADTTAPNASPAINEAPVSDNGQGSAAHAPPATTKSKRKPRTTANAPQDDGVEPNANSPKRRAPTRRKKLATTLGGMDAEEAEASAQAEEEEEAGPVPRKRVSAKAKGKRKAAETADGAPAPKKTRKPRKDKGKKRATEVQEEAQGVDGDAEGAAPASRKRKAKPRKKKNAQQTEAEGEGEGEGDEGQEEQRTKRRRRVDTPSDAENERIDEATELMNGLASRNIRVGHLSEREKKMREANWEEIKEEQRKRDALHVDHSQREEAERIETERKRDEATRLRAANEQVFEYNRDGELVLTEKARTIDQAGAADLEIAAMVTVEENDFTRQTNNKSYLRSNKRLPQEFMLPGQGKRWNAEATDKFYEALGMFGTDFMMVSTMFPGSTRRSIKLKFTREERANPTRIKETLQGRINTDWDHYLQESGADPGAFRDDPDVLNRELAAEREGMEEQIQAAKDAAEEERRQRRIAGIESEEENAEEDNQNGKGKKKRGRKDKTVTFAQEEGLEVLGEIDQDDGWGQQ
jgi:transcription factor TFIIIB component B''